MSGCGNGLVEAGSRAKKAKILRGKEASDPHGGSRPEVGPGLGARSSHPSSPCTDVHFGGRGAARPGLQLPSPFSFPAFLLSRRSRSPAGEVRAATSAVRPEEQRAARVSGNASKSFAPKVGTADASSFCASCRLWGRQLFVAHIPPPIPQAACSACSTRDQRHWCSWELC